MGVTVYGSSDDLIEVEGDVTEEFYALSDGDDGSLLAFSNGVVLRVRYSNTGVWRIEPVAGCPPNRVEFTPAPEDDDSNYSDRAVMDEPVSWVVCGSAIGRA